MSSAAAQRAPIASLGSRLLALIIDVLTWAFLASLAGLALVSWAPDSFGMASAWPESKSCRKLDALPPRIAPPAGLSPTSIKHCTTSFLGVPFRDEVTAQEEHDAGRFTTQRSLTYTVGPDLAPNDVFELDGPFWLAFFGYVVLAQGWAGATLGKWIFGLRVIDRYRLPPGLRAAAIRNLVLGGQWLLGIVVAYSPLSGRVFSNPWLWFSLALVVWLAQLAVWIEIAIKAYRRSPGIHDRLAGTRVVYLPPHAENGVG
jgi:uncharacterized RDD family membrane protein YckC